jgi:hypothetical protein
MSFLRMVTSPSPQASGLTPQSSYKIPGGSFIALPKNFYGHEIPGGSFIALPKNLLSEEHHIFGGRCWTSSYLVIVAVSS